MRDCSPDCYEVINSYKSGIQRLNCNLEGSYVRPNHLYSLRGALEANLMLVKVDHTVKNTPKRSKTTKNCQN